MLAADLSLVPPQSRVLVAVSGGADSLALLLWLLEQERDLVVGHVNHALDELRGGDCARDEAWLELRCAELNTPFRSETIELARRGGHVGEAAAREGRYAALVRLAQENECDLVATAHTASDALEGLILSVGRGAGLGGLRGFAPSRQLAPGLTLVRPLWRIGRESVRDWLREQNETWLEDASNQNTLFRRNRVRNDVLPLLSSIFGREGDGLARGFALNAALARDEEVFIEAAARQELERLVLKREDGLIVLGGLELGSVQVALQRRVLRLAAREVAGENLNAPRERVEEVRLAVMSQSVRRVWTWRGDLRVEWTGPGAGNRVRFWRV